MPPPTRKQTLAGQLLLAALLVLGFLLVLARPYVEYLWLANQGQGQVFWTLVWAHLICAGVGAAVGFASSFASLRFAAHCWPSLELTVAGFERPKFLKTMALVASGAGALLTGLLGFGVAPRALAWLHQQPFSIKDPLFGKDVAFYVFSLPFWNALVDLGLVCAFLAVAFPAIYYLGRVAKMSEVSRIPRDVLRHVWLVAGFLLLVQGSNFVLDRYELAVSGSGTAAGAGYVDANVVAPTLLVLAGLSWVVGLALIFTNKIDEPLRQLGAIGLLLLAVVVGLGPIPSMVQQYKVRPNEISLERPYIEYAISMTWKAFGFEDIQESDFPASQPLTRENLDKYQATLKNIRLWDPGPLKDSYQQLQSLRTYYRFNDVDIDRYQVGDTLRQVMLSAREIPMDQGHETWVNRHLQYTHGYGLAMNPVNEMTHEGQPRFWIQDLPPISEVNIQVERPEIYFGELTNWFVVANTDEQELDYAKGDKNVYTHYEGSGGVQVGGFGRRLALAIYFRDLNLLLSSAIKPQSRALFHRNIIERVQTLAPFLETDDPYLVVSEGKLYWIIDLYTVSGRFPYSRATGTLNYLRNSVKAIIDPYSGEVRLVVVDPSDPMLATYRKIFPSLFVDADTVEPDLRRHFRYPERLLTLQAEVYNVYHMVDPQVFYNKEDLWEFALENYHGREQKVQPYYMVMRLPGEEKPEFILMLPLVPKDKDNMIAWMAARCDGENYGKLFLFRFPKDRLIYGPRQIEARIDQDTVISQQLTLWQQKGSQVLRGKFLVIPVEDSLLYVEPLYLQANAARMPELKRIIVSSSNPESKDQERATVVMEQTLDRALVAAFGPGAAVSEEVPEPGAEPALVPDPGVEPVGDPEVGEVVRQALQHMQRADEALETYRQEMQRARTLLERIYRP